MKHFFLFFAGALLLVSCKKGDNKSNDDKNNDAIRASLTSSVSAYDNASADNWVSITATEYENLLVKVKSSQIAGADEAFMQSTPEHGWLADRTVGGSTSMTKVPASSYIIALSVKSGTGPSTSLNSKLKVSDGNTTNYKDYGQPLPAIGEVALKTRTYFVLKTPTAILSSNPNFTALYNASSQFLGSRSVGSTFYSNGDISPASIDPRSSYYQVISTSSKQW